jgi:dTDP-4-dehydrorhamnose 3,5-epimerase
MKLNKPIVFKKIFSTFDDDRGFLSTLDIKNLYQNLPDQNFNLTYQLISYSAKKNTFRGMHYQTKPYSQNKLIVLHQGSIIDLAVDVNNTNIEQVLRFEMSAGDAILIPENYAHGFISLTDEVLLQYFMDNEYSKENYKGLNLKKYLEREFPKLDLIVSDKDKNLNNFIL